MRSSKLVRSEVRKSMVCILVVLMAIFACNGAIMAQDDADDSGNDKWQQKREEMRQKSEERKQAWQGKKSGLTFEEDSGAGNGHEEGKPGTRVGHSDDMPGKRLGHRKDFENTGDENGSANVDKVNRPQRPDKVKNDIKNGFRHRQRMLDSDDNPPGRRGGEGTNWENLPGRKSGPGMSPDKFRKGENQQGECGNNQQPRRFGKRCFKGNSENTDNNGSNGLHIGNRKNGAGKGIKNYSGRTRANKGKKNN